MRRGASISPCSCASTSGWVAPPRSRTVVKPRSSMPFMIARGAIGDERVGHERILADVDHRRDDVDVAVDEPGHQRALAAIHDGGILRLDRLVGQFPDPVSFDEHLVAGHDLGADGRSSRPKLRTDLRHGSHPCVEVMRIAEHGKGRTGASRRRSCHAASAQRRDTFDLDIEGQGPWLDRGTGAGRKSVGKAFAIDGIDTAHQCRIGDEDVAFTTWARDEPPQESVASSASSAARGWVAMSPVDDVAGHQIDRGACRR